MTDSLSPSEKTSRPPGAPRWVKLAAAVTGLFFVMVVAMLLLGDGGAGGGHGPGRHG